MADKESTLKPLAEKKNCLRFASLGSGSSGNATLIANGDEAILIDCGFSAREAVSRLERLSFPVSGIKAVFVTHEHGDHAKGISVLSRRHNIPVYTSRGTSVAAGFDNLEALHFIHADTPVNIAGFKIMPVTVPHDAREPLQFVVTLGDHRLGVLTDLGGITPTVIKAYTGCDALLLEANHDLEMLARGPYPVSVQSRVSGAWGHLNNQQTANLLAELDLQNIQHLVVGHISQKNNCLTIVKDTLAPFVSALPTVHYACQDEGFDWLHLS